MEVKAKSRYQTHQVEHYNIKAFKKKPNNILSIPLPGWVGSDGRLINPSKISNSINVELYHS